MVWIQPMSLTFKLVPFQGCLAPGNSPSMKDRVISKGNSMLVFSDMAASSQWDIPAPKGSGKASLAPCRERETEAGENFPFPTWTFSCQVKLQAAKSPLEEVVSQQSRRRGMPFPGWPLGRGLGIAEDTKHQVSLCGCDLDLLAPNPEMQFNRSYFCP